MKRFISLAFISMIFLSYASFAFAQVPNVPRAVCAFRCNEATQLCQPGCPPRPTANQNPGGLFAPGGPGPFLIIVFIFFVIIVIVVQVQRARRLAQVNLPPAQPPIMGGPPAPPAPAAGAAPAAPIPAPPVPPVPPVPAPPIPTPPAPPRRRIFRAVYGKKTAPKPSSHPTNTKIEKF